MGWGWYPADSGKPGRNSNQHLVSRVWFCFLLNTYSAFFGHGSSGRHKFRHCFTLAGMGAAIHLKPLLSFLSVSLVWGACHIHFWRGSIARLPCQGTYQSRFLFEVRRPFAWSDFRCMDPKANCQKQIYWERATKTQASCPDLDSVMDNHHHCRSISRLYP